MLKKIILFIFLSSIVYAENSYELGEGIEVSKLPIFIGGYISTDYRYKDNEHRFRVDDLALLSYGAYHSLSYMAEIEFKELYVITKDEETTQTTQDKRVYIERLYLDYALNDSFFLRLGKYNTPIGFWNLLPINILRDTSSNPISNEVIYPKFTTGLGAKYSSFDEGEINIDFIFQHNDSLDNDYNNYEIDTHYGLGVSYEYNSYTLKINSGYFQKVESVDEYIYTLLSAKYESDRYKFMGEFGSQYSQKNSDFIYSGYFQGLYNFTDKHAGIIRLEYLSNTVDDEDDSVAVFAYTYRPLYAIALKSEYQLHSKDKSDQLILSFSVLF